MKINTTIIIIGALVAIAIMPFLTVLGVCYIFTEFLINLIGLFKSKPKQKEKKKGSSFDPIEIFQSAMAKSNGKF